MSIEYRSATGALAFRLMSAGVLVFSLLGTAWGQCTALGAIRWDAWHGALGEPGKVVSTSLSPEQFQSRAPFCSRIVSSAKVEIDCSGQEIMDREIRYAVEAGLDYWAFVAYQPESSMSLGLKTYLESNIRSLLRFSVIITPQSLREPPDRQPRDAPPTNLDRFVEYASHPDYQRVAGGRPLVFFLPYGVFLDRPGNDLWLRDVVARFRKQLLGKGESNPYMVLMHFNPELGRKVAAELGFDAISSYAVLATDRKHQPYKALADETRNFWERAKGTGAKFVPPIMAGWDRRPRVVTPSPWETYYRNRPDEISYYFAAPTPAELAGHVAEAVAWVTKNRSTVEADAAIIYAWNENDEGGWLVPTLGEGDARVKAVGARVRQLCPAKSRVRTPG